MPVPVQDAKWEADKHVLVAGRGQGEDPRFGSFRCTDGDGIVTVYRVCCANALSKGCAKNAFQLADGFRIADAAQGNNVPPVRDSPCSRAAESS